MANIQISQLNLTGAALLEDKESFLNELDTQDLATVIGGGHRRHSGHYSHNYSHHYSHDYSYHDHHHKHHKHSCWY